MKILVLGDSHTAAVKYGWDAIAQNHPDKELDFFALPQVRMKRLQRDGSLLLLGPKASAGDKHRLKARFPDGYIDTDQYDAIFLVGLIETGHTLIAANYHTRLPHQIHSQPRRLWQLGKEGADIPADKQIATRAMFEATWDSIFKASVARILLWHMKKLGTPRCVLAVNPMLSAGALNLIHPLRPAISTALANDDAQMFIDMARDRLLAQLPANVTLMDQPPETIEQGCLTKTEYMTAAKTFYNKDKSFGRFDTLHANEEYGILLLTHLFAHLDTPEAEA